jgi:transposase
MGDLTLFVGLDVHKKTISVAMVEAAAGAEVRFYGMIAHTPDIIRALCCDIVILDNLAAHKLLPTFSRTPPRL